jgi:rare lipoprotein A
MQKRLAAAAGLALATMAFFPSPSSATNLCGGASWYALHSRTASGERMNPAAMTAAHRTLPLGTRVRVTNKRNGKTVDVRINDRGPFIRGRILDLSRAAARELGFISAGHAPVCFTRL